MWEETDEGWLPVQLLQGLALVLVFGMGEVTGDVVDDRGGGDWCVRSEGNGGWDKVPIGLSVMGIMFITIIVTIHMYMYIIM